MIRNRERQTCNDHVRKRFARNVDSAPKTVGAEKDTAWGRFKLLQQFAARCAAALHEQVHSLFHKKLLHLTADLLHVAITREQNECTTVRLLHEMRDPMFKLLRVIGIA